MLRNSDTVPKLDITEIFCEFLEVSIHNILYLRKLYPDSIFSNYMKYGVIVHQSEHPTLNEYIVKVLKAAQFHAKQNQLRQLLVCIRRELITVETFVFDILQLQQEQIDSDPLLVKLEEAFRTFLLKLSALNGSLKYPPSELEFNVMLHVTEYSASSLNNEPGHIDFPWIQTHNTSLESLSIIPLHTIDTDHLILQIYIES